MESEKYFLWQRERKICRGTAFEGTFFGSVMMRIIVTAMVKSSPMALVGSDPSVSPEDGKVTPVSA
jgi:hypothetical protein